MAQVGGSFFWASCQSYIGYPVRGAAMSPAPAALQLGPPPGLLHGETSAQARDRRRREATYRNIEAALVAKLDRFQHQLESILALLQYDGRIAVKYNENERAATTQHAELSMDVHGKVSHAARLLDAATDTIASSAHLGHETLDMCIVPQGSNSERAALAPHAEFNIGLNDKVSDATKLLDAEGGTTTSTGHLHHETHETHSDALFGKSSLPHLGKPSSADTQCALSPSVQPECADTPGSTTLPASTIASNSSCTSRPTTSSSTSTCVLSNVSSPMPACMASVLPMKGHMSISGGIPMLLSARFDTSAAVHHPVLATVSPSVLEHSSTQIGFHNEPLHVTCGASSMISLRVASAAAVRDTKAAGPDQLEHKLHELECGVPGVGEIGAGAGICKPPQSCTIPLCICGKLWLPHCESYAEPRVCQGCSAGIRANASTFLCQSCGFRLCTSCGMKLVDINGMHACIRPGMT